MNKNHGLILGTLIALLVLFSGCEGVDNWWKREHALKPLKERYWNGELSWNEYRSEKKALIAELERRNYQTPGEVAEAKAEALRNQAADEHSESGLAESIRSTTSDDILLEQDEAMIKQTETAAFVYDEPAAPARAPTYAPASAPASSNTTVPGSATSGEMITDGRDLGWVRNPDGSITYTTSPATAALSEQQVTPGRSMQPPALPQEPVTQSFAPPPSPPPPPPPAPPPAPAAEKKPADSSALEVPAPAPARERNEEAPVIIDLDL